MSPSIGASKYSANHTFNSTMISTLATPASTNQRPTIFETARERQCVVLLHGLGANRLLMQPLSRRLNDAGFQAINWGYWSTRHRIEYHAEKFSRLIADLHHQPSCDYVHLVTHSMGGIVARQVLAKYYFSKMGRMVMMAPPNSGSSVARRMSKVLNWICRPLGQLSDEPDSFVNQIPDFRTTNRIEFGVIQASRDRVVAPESTRLAGQTAHTVVDSHHGILPWNQRAMEQAEHFLVEGRFKSDS